MIGSAASMLRLSHDFGKQENVGSKFPVFSDAVQRA
jgi:hypothetical protein